MTEYEARAMASEAMNKMVPWSKEAVDDNIKKVISGTGQAKGWFYLQPIIGSAEGVRTIRKSILHHLRGNGIRAKIGRRGRLFFNANERWPSKVSHRVRAVRSEIIALLVSLAASTVVVAAITGSAILIDEASKETPEPIPTVTEKPADW